MAESETDYQAKIVEWATLNGWLAYHTYDSRHSVKGFPDLVLVRPPEVIYWEVKTATGRATPEQEKWIDALYKSGQEVRIVRPADWLMIEARLRRRRATR